MNEPFSSLVLNENQVFGCLKRAAILSFSLTYLLRLIDYSFIHGEIQREAYLRLICKSCNNFVQQKDQILENIFIAPSPSEWTNTLFEETKSFSNIIIRSEDQTFNEELGTPLKVTNRELPDAFFLKYELQAH
jgi:hypothetical protein